MPNGEYTPRSLCSMPSLRGEPRRIPIVSNNEHGVEGKCNVSTATVTPSVTDYESSSSSSAATPAAAALTSEGGVGGSVVDANSDSITIDSLTASRRLADVFGHTISNDTNINDDNSNNGDNRSSVLASMMKTTTYSSSSSISGHGCNITIQKLRDIVIDNLNRHQYESAMFWAGKVVSLLDDSHTDDIRMLAHTLLLAGHPRRAVNLLRRHNLLDSDQHSRYLAAKALYELKQWEEALELLENVGVKEDLRSSDLNGSCWLLKGLLFEAVSKRGRATECYRRALMEDIFCSEAMDRITFNHLLSQEEEQRLLCALPYDQCEGLPGMEGLLRCLYSSKLKDSTSKHNSSNDDVASFIYHDDHAISKLPEPLRCISKDPDIVAARAQRLLAACRLRECLALTRSVLDVDGYHPAMLLVYAACLVEMKQTNDLFILAHRLVENEPRSAVSWYTVGCYYFATNQHSATRQHFSKATTLDESFGPAWLGFGHSFAAEGEHDQALAAYCTAARLLTGCHLPLLCIGIEYVQTSNISLAEQYFERALAICNYDPLLFHELGVVCYRSGRFCDAVVHFQSALVLIEENTTNVFNASISDTWEPTLSNLGHSLRKMGCYDEALGAYSRALALKPTCASTISAVGFTHLILGDTSRAIELFHQALSISPDDAFTVQMLTKAFKESSIDLPLLPSTDNEDGFIFCEDQQVDDEGDTEMG